METARMETDRTGTSAAAAPKAADSVPALRRSVLILDLVASAGSPLSATDITRALALPKSTAHGLLNVMLELGLLARNPEGSFRLGPHPMRWANSFLSQMDVVAVFRDYFAQDATLSRYTMTLTILDGAEVVYIGCRNSDLPLGHTFRIGMRLPAPFTATGKMLLSEIADGELEALFGRNFPSPMTQRSVKNLPQLRQELSTTRERGFSIDDGQIRDGMICVGAALRDHSGKAIAGIATSLMRSEASADIIGELGSTMRATAGRLSEQLGHAGLRRG